MHRHVPVSSQRKLAGCKERFFLLHCPFLFSPRKLSSPFLAPNAEISSCSPISSTCRKTSTSSRDIFFSCSFSSAYYLPWFSYLFLQNINFFKKITLNKQKHIWLQSLVSPRLVSMHHFQFHSRPLPICCVWWILRELSVECPSRSLMSHLVWQPSLWPLK